MKRTLQQWRAWATAVETNDPVQQLQNKVLAVIILASMVGTVVAIPAFLVAPAPLYQVATLVGFIPVLGLAFWLNRKGTHYGAVIMTTIAILATVLVADPYKHFVPWGKPVIIDSIVLLPIVFAAFFLNVRAGVGTALLVEFLLIFFGLANHLPPDHISNFAIFGALVLLPNVAVLVAVAHVYQHALRETFNINAQQKKTIETYLRLMRSEKNRRDESQPDAQHTQTDDPEPPDHP